MTTTQPILDKRFGEQQISRILEQAAIYVCACPAQVCQAINEQRRLFAYQAQCLDATDTDKAVHERIARAAQLAHAELEQCLVDVLQLEGWDMATLTMPKMLEKRIIQSLQDEK